MAWLRWVPSAVLERLPSAASAQQAPAPPSDEFSPTRDGLQLARKLAFRFRAQLAPVYLLAAGLFVGSVVSGQGLGSGFLAALLGCSGAAWRLRKAFSRSHVRLEAGVCMGLASVWLLAVSVVGFPALDWLAVVLWLGPAVLWWLRHRVRREDVAAAFSAVASRPDPDPASDPDPDAEVARPLLGPVAVGAEFTDDLPPEDPPIGSSATLVIPRQEEMSEIQRRWYENLHGRRPGLKGSFLSSPVPFDYGETYTLQLVPGVQHFEQVQSELPWVATGLGCQIEDLVLEKYPDVRDSAILRLRVVTNSPIRETVWFQEPVYKDGRITLGPYGDGCGDASFRLYTDNRMYGGFVLGSTGSGKTRMIEIIALTALSLGNTIIIYVDGQNGASSPLLYKHATWSGGVEESLDMLEALERGMRKRQLYNRVYELSGFDPLPTYPGILVIVDECHRIYTEKTGERWGNVAREGGKLGMAKLAASQYTKLETTFGGAGALLSSLLAGNGYAMRTVSRVGKQMLPGLDLDPARLPEMPGYGYVVAASGDSHARSVSFRGQYAPDERDRAKSQGGDVPTISDWFELAREERWAPEVDQMTANAFGPDFVNRHEIAERRRADLIASFENSAASGAVPLPLHHPPAPVESPQRCADAILALPWDAYGGEMRRAAMLNELPAEHRIPSTVASALKSLLASGQVTQVDKGIYRLETLS